MQELVNKPSVRALGKRLFDQPAKPAKIAFNLSQFHSGFLMLQARDWSA